MYPAPPVTRMFNATSSIVKQNHEAGSHTGLSGTKLFPHLQRTPEFYTIAKTRGKLPLRCVYTRFGVLLVSSK
jgi:hypothetical protein